ncbi:hypothetical protein [Pseudoalteromonas piscicida]|uniref:Uncharacterized protein n=1 Tax=Pseudoalteromonas piscicida TaxID=43662 RepID=A0A2A5JKK0_PSEO7|nr:hypothetical protein [Pseudoalteromonas piscicida]PCK29965.1 hypothetical protein CEX98_20040 [Pseudoalteromonas piscicida]
MRKIDNDSEYYTWFMDTSKQCGKFVYEQPGVLISLGYLTLNLSGFVYLLFLFNAFSIDIIKYMELSDFMMAFLAEPAILFATFSAIICSSSIAYLMSRLYKLSGGTTFKGWKSWLLTYRMLYRFNPFYTFVIVTIFVFPNLYAGLLGAWNSDSIKQGDGKLYSFDLINPINLDQQGKRHFKDMQIILESERYVFLYEQSKSRTVILSRENIASIQMGVQDIDN